MPSQPGWSTRRIAGLGATPDFRHGLLNQEHRASLTLQSGDQEASQASWEDSERDSPETLHGNTQSACGHAPLEISPTRSSVDIPWRFTVFHRGIALARVTLRWRS